MFLVFFVVWFGWGLGGACALRWSGPSSGWLGPAVPFWVPLPLVLASWVCSVGRFLSLFFFFFFEHRKLLQRGFFALHS